MTAAPSPRVEPVTTPQEARVIVARTLHDHDDGDLNLPFSRCLELAEEILHALGEPVSGDAADAARRIRAYVAELDRHYGADLDQTYDDVIDYPAGWDGTGHPLRLSDLRALVAGGGDQ